MPTKKQMALTGGAITMAVIAGYFTSQFEGEKFKAYRDGGGVWTDCRGHTKDVHEGDVATKAQCDQFYKEDMLDAENIFNKYVHVDVPQNVGAAELDFIFNTGEQNFKKSTILKKTNAKEFTAVCAEFPKWHYINKKDCAILSNNCYGLVTRRAKEKELCLDKNDYNSFDLDNDNVLFGIRASQPGIKSR